MQSLRLKVYSIDGVTLVVHRLSFVHPEAVLISLYRARHALDVVRLHPLI